MLFRSVSQSRYGVRKYVCGSRCVLCVLCVCVFVLGPEMEAFEQEIGKWIEVPHAVGVSNGSDALLLALQAVGVGPGDEVICPTFTFFATAGAVARLGGVPVFVDSAECCYNLRADQVAGIGVMTFSCLPWFQSPL